MEIIHQLDEQVWKEFVDKHPQGNIFHTPEMSQVFSNAKGYQPCLWAVIDETGNPLALLPVIQITLRGGLLRKYTTRAVAFGSVLIALLPESRRAVEALLQAYTRENAGRILFTELRNQANLNDLQPVLNKYGFIWEGHLNYLVDLRGTIDKIWANLLPNARSNVKKARVKGVVIEEARSLQLLHYAYSLLQDTYTQIRVPLADFSLFQAVFKILEPKGMAKFFMARVGNKYIGTSIVLIYKETIYGWYAATSRDYSSFKAADLLNWYVLEYGQQNGYAFFDFGGAGKPDEEYGPRNFKAKFGGELVNYGRNICIHSPHSYHFSKQVYTWMQKGLMLRSSNSKHQNNAKNA